MNKCTWTVHYAPAVGGNLDSMKPDFHWENLHYQGNPGQALILRSVVRLYKVHKMVAPMDVVIG